MRSLVAAIVLSWSIVASANGRPPATSSIQFRAGSSTDVLAGMTFGVLLSHDNGATWQWMCEAAVGYGGEYDPHYLWLPSTTILATTVDGLHATTDDCTFARTSLGGTYAARLALGPDAAVYVAMSDPSDGNIYKSVDGGTTFPQAASPGQAGDTWESLVVAASDADRVYLSGVRFVAGSPTLELFKSIDGAKTFSPLSLASFSPISANSSLEIAGVSPMNADVVFVRITNETGTVGDSIYRSIDGGSTFAKVFTLADSILGFVVRASGEIVLGSPAHGLYHSLDGGVTFQPLAAGPAMHCLVEDATGVLWACVDDSSAVGAARSTDGVMWTPAIRYADIASPSLCAAGTVQADTCQATIWCTLRSQLGIIANPTSCPYLDGAPDVTAPRKRGCCDGGGGSAGVLVVGVALRLLRRRRHGDSSSTPIIPAS